MRYCFDDATAAERHETQYFECVCNRGIYHKGWTAVTRHSTPWVPGALPSVDEDTWELYDTLSPAGRSSSRAPASCCSPVWGG
jgi:arylsulfatase A-like enzyme